MSMKLATVLLLATLLPHSIAQPIKEAAPAATPAAVGTPSATSPTCATYTSFLPASTTTACLNGVVSTTDDSGTSTILGRYSKTVGGVMQYTGGAPCDANTQYSSSVTLTCGADTTLVSVSKAGCNYVMTMTSPSACGDKPASPAVVPSPVLEASPALPSPALPSPVVPSPKALPSPALLSPALPSPALPSPALTSPALPSPALPSPALPSPALRSPAIPSPEISPEISPELSPEISPEVSPAVIKKQPRKPVIAAASPALPSPSPSPAADVVLVAPTAEAPGSTSTSRGAGDLGQGALPKAPEDDDKQRKLTKQNAVMAGIIIGPALVFGTVLCWGALFTWRWYKDREQPADASLTDPFSTIDNPIAASKADPSSSMTPPPAPRLPSSSHWV